MWANRDPGALGREVSDRTGLVEWFESVELYDALGALQTHLSEKAVAVSESLSTLRTP
jgi:hypothetical protein